MGAVNTTYTFTPTDTITSTKMNNIIDETVMTSDAVLNEGGLVIASGKLAIAQGAINSSRLAANSVSSENIVDGTIVNADISPTAAIAGTKISPNFGTQNIVTTGTISTSTNYLSRQQTPDEGGEIQFARALDNATAFTVDCYGSGSSPDLRIFGTTGQVATITASGNVGIGTSSPQNVFEVNAYSTARSSANAGTAKIEAQSNDYWTGATYTGTSITQSGSAATGTTCGLSNANLGALTFQNGSAGLINTNGATPIVFATTSSERMRINGSGNIGIGKPNPSTILDVNGTVTATAFSGPLVGNASSATIAASCSGNSATATTAESCTGNAATATTAASCTGNSATATIAASCSGNSATATTAESCTGNAATATTAASCTGNSATATIAASCSGNSATATLATKASTLSQGGGTGNAMTFNWNDGGSQPPWIWGGINGSDHYVYNPSNFSVNYANSAGSATTASTVSNGAITAAKLDGAQSGTAPIYGVRAWVNFDASRDSSGNVNSSNTNRLIRSSGNVTSVSKTATGKFTITFTTPMPDANYAVTSSSGTSPGGPRFSCADRSTATVNTVKIETDNAGGAAADFNENNVMVIR